MVDHYHRQACLILLLAGTFFVGPLISEVGAQPTQDDRGNRVELLVGGGDAWTPRECYTCKVATFDVGVTYWGRNHWGISARHEFRPDDYVDNPYASPPYPIFLNLQISSVTARRRWFQDNGAEFDFGFGMAAGSLGGSFIIGFVPAELFVGRKVFRHIGVKGGVSLACFFGDGCGMRSRLVGLAVIGF